MCYKEEEEGRLCQGIDILGGYMCPTNHHTAHIICMRHDHSYLYHIKSGKGGMCLCFHDMLSLQLQVSTKQKE